MKIKINIGKAQLEFEGRDYKEVIKEAGAFTEAGKCSLCDSTNIALSYRPVKGKEGTPNAGKTFEYYEAICKNCYAKMQFGEYQSGGFFAKRFEKYQKENPTPTKTQTDPDPTPPPQTNEEMGEDIPF